MSGAVFVPEHRWQPSGLSRLDSLKKAGKVRAFYEGLSDAAKRYGRAKSGNRTT